MDSQFGPLFSMEIGDDFKTYAAPRSLSGSVHVIFLNIIACNMYRFLKIWLFDSPSWVAGYPGRSAEVPDPLNMIRVPYSRFTRAKTKWNPGRAQQGRTSRDERERYKWERYQIKDLREKIVTFHNKLEGDFQNISRSENKTFHERLIAQKHFRISSW